IKGPSGRRDVAWRFVHHLTCQTLAGEIPHLRRQRIHLHVADAMLRVDRESRLYTSAIAHHLYYAGRLANPGRTARALIAAGDAAAAVYANEDAVQHYRRALEIMQDTSGDDLDRLAIQETLADLLAVLGDRGAAMQQYEDVAGAYRSTHATVDH